MQAVLVQVAAATGQPLRALARESYALTLWTMLGLHEMERFRTFTRRAERLDAAGLAALATHDPQRLRDADAALREDAGLTVPVETALARGAALHQAIVQGGVLRETGS